MIVKKCVTRDGLDRRGSVIATAVQPYFLNQNWHNFLLGVPSHIQGTSAFPTVRYRRRQTIC